jgi:hypothetical protein
LIPFLRKPEEAASEVSDKDARKTALEFEREQRRRKSERQREIASQARAVRKWLWPPPKRL